MCTTQNSLLVLIFCKYINKAHSPNIRRRFSNIWKIRTTCVSNMQVEVNYILGFTLTPNSPHSHFPTVLSKAK